MTQEVINELLFWGLIAGIWWFWHFPYREYRIDRLRQKLFSLRDDLFGEASQNEIDFNSLAYTMTRTTLNGMIRFAHDLSFLRLAFSYFMSKQINGHKTVERYYSQMDGALHQLTSENKRKILETHLHMHLAVIDHIVRCSMILSAIFIPLSLALKWQHIVLRGNKSRKRMSFVDAEANGIGHTYA